MAGPAARVSPWCHHVGTTLTVHRPEEPRPGMAKGQLVSNTNWFPHTKGRRSFRDAPCRPSGVGPGTSLRIEDGVAGVRGAAGRSELGVAGASPTPSAVSPMRTRSNPRQRFGSRRRQHPPKPTSRKGASLVTDRKGGRVNLLAQGAPRWNRWTSPAGEPRRAERDAGLQLSPPEVGPDRRHGRQVG